MHKPKRYLKILAIAALALAMAGMAEAKGKKEKAADRFYKAGQKAETAQNWDEALSDYEQALSANPSDLSYQIAVKRVRFQAAQAHVHNGQMLRRQDRLVEALAEFEKAYAMDPSSAIADQEMKRTLDMMHRENQKAAAPDERGLTAAELAQKKEAERIARLEQPPELRPLSSQPINLRMTNQPPRILYETVAKLAGINVVFDPDYRSDPNANRQLSLELTNSTLEDALDYLATMTKTFWQPMSSNTIFVAADTRPKRTEYQDTAVKVFYLENATSPQELTEITTTLRTVADIRKAFQVNALNAIVVKGTTDQLALVEKLVNDLDKPRAEVVVDVVIMEADKAKTRDIGVTPVSGGIPGISAGVIFAPNGPSTGGDSTTQTQQLISLSRIAKLSSNDFAVTLPSAVLKFMMTDRSTRVLQSPQVRAANGEKASLRIGDRVPVAQGGFQPFGGTAGGYNSLYSQFNFIDVGVNVDITPIVHGDGEVTLKVVFDVSNVRDHVDIGGISQPVIGQRKIEHTIRIKAGEASLIGGLMQDQDTKSVGGVPGLASIPIIKRLFSSESIDRSQSELLIALIPHIVRTNGITDLNLRSVATGPDQVVRVSREPRPVKAPEVAPAETTPAQPAAAPAAPPATIPGAPARTGSDTMNRPAPGMANVPIPGVPQVTAPSGGEAPPAAAPAAPPATVQQAPTAAVTAPDTHFTLRPISTTVKKGATITLQLYAENVRDLAAAPLHLKFNPQILRMEKVEAGPLLGSDGKRVIFTRNILNDTGDVSIQLGRMPDAGGVTGSGVLAQFTFKAVGSGDAFVTMSEFSPRNAKQQEIATDVPHAVITVK